MTFFIRNKLSKAAVIILAVITLTLSVSPYITGGVASAAGTPEAKNVKTNLWGSGGQISFDLSGCDGYMTITVVVEFNSNVNSPSGWGFDSYTANGKQVTAVVNANGANSWGFNSNVGIQVFGSGLSSASVVSVSGSGTYSGNTNNNNNNANNQNNNQNNNGNNEQNSSAKPKFSSPAVSTYGTAGDDWLTTQGAKIIDMNGNEVWLTGCNWFGYNTGTNIFDGLWNADLNTSVNAIADHGFNLIRIPISTELVNQWEDGTYPQANFNQATNSYLVGMNSLEIFNYVIGQCRANGMKIMIDFHCATTNAAGHNYPLWCDDKISEKDYIRALEWIASTYKDDDTIIAIDLENEPHGKPDESPRAKWDDSKDSDNWKYIAEKAGLAVLNKNPNLLVMVEGIECYPVDTKKNGNYKSTDKSDYYFNWWGGNLRGVADNPVDLGKYNNKLVYSPHDYGPTVYEQPWFEGSYTFDSLMDDCWRDNWFYIYEQKKAPLLIGEWGGFMKEPNLTWMTYCRKLIKENKLHHTFWCFNANSGDTGGLVLDDFTTWDNDKYEFVKEVLWQTNDGKFIGLDHQIPLGENGISLSDYY